MKKIFSIFLIFILSGAFNYKLLSQNRTVDSLNLLLKHTDDDAVRLNLYLKLCDACEIEDNLKYGNLTLHLVNNLLSENGNKKRRTELFKQKLQVLKIIKWYYYKKEKNLAKVIEYSNEQISVNKELKDTVAIENILSRIVTDIFQLGQASVAMDTVLLRLKAHERVGDKRRMAVDLEQVASIYARTYNSTKAIDYNWQAIKIYEQLHDTIAIGNLYGNLGYHYDKSGDYKKALEFKLLNLEAVKKSDDPRKTLTSLFGIAVTYRKLSDSANAFKYQLRCLKIAEQINDIYMVGSSQIDLGDIYFEFGDNKNALIYYLKSIETLKKTRKTDFLYPPLYSIGEVYLKESKYQMALVYAEQAEKITQSQNGFYSKKQIQSLLYRIYKAKGDKIKEGEHHLSYILLKDTIEKTESQSVFAQKEMRYEFEKSEFERILEQNRKDAHTKEEKQQQIFLRNMFLLGFILLLIIVIVIFRSYKQKQKTNKELEQKNKLIAVQKHLVEEKQQEIIESITYAKRLQEAILPPQEFIDKHLPNNFILYKPKDLVAGDFYWAEKIGSKFYIAAADSTGHGVPGAMVSVVCSNALNRTIKEFKESETGKILDKTRELVLETFEKSTSEVKDGMDISLLCVDIINKKISWSGANNPLWYVRNNELEEIKADKQPIGKTEYPRPFITHQIEYIEGTTFYLFTDGFADQFGGPNGKKFKYKQFSESLLKINQKNKTDQCRLIEKTFEDWKGNLEQVDDVCVIGIRI